jgi:hypothetical protein
MLCTTSAPARSLPRGDSGATGRLARAEVHGHCGPAALLVEGLPPAMRDAGSTVAGAGALRPRPLGARCIEPHCILPRARPTWVWMGLEGTPGLRCGAGSSRSCGGPSLFQLSRKFVFERV